MKSAYELAMERLQASDPNAVQPVPEAVKQQLAELDRKYQAKIAERELFLNQKLAEARRQRDATAIQQLQEQLRNERIRLEEEREAAKEKVRRSI